MQTQDTIQRLFHTISTPASAQLGHAQSGLTRMAAQTISDEIKDPVQPKDSDGQEPHWHPTLPVNQERQGSDLVGELATIRAALRELQTTQVFAVLILGCSD